MSLSILLGLKPFVPPEGTLRPRKKPEPDEEPIAEPTEDPCPHPKGSPLAFVWRCEQVIKIMSDGQPYSVADLALSIAHLNLKKDTVRATLNRLVFQGILERTDELIGSHQPIYYWIADNAPPIPKPAYKMRETERTCISCGVTKPIDKFHGSNKGRARKCRVCYRKDSLKKKQLSAPGDC